jgi:hypothetical protein
MVEASSWMCDARGSTPQRRKRLSGDHEKGPQAAAAMQAKHPDARWARNSPPYLQR